MIPTRLRHAALIAFRSGLGILLTTLVALPFLSLVHRIFDGTWRVDWRMALTVTGVVAAAWVAFLFFAAWLEFAADEKRERQRQFVFPGVMWLRGICLTAILLGILLMAGTYREGDPWWVVGLNSTFILLGFCAWPRAIEITDKEVRQRRMLFGYKRIPLTGIESVVSDAGQGEAVVFGRNGVRIVHTTMHAQRARFLERLEHVAGKEARTVGDFLDGAAAK